MKNDKDIANKTSNVNGKSIFFLLKPEAKI
jgi:hypothetical protein